MRTQISNLFSTRSPLVRKQEGASAVEYGLILGLIAVAIVTILITMREPLQNLFTNAKTGVTQAAGSSGS